MLLIGALAIAKSDYGGTGDLMARCMQYASESHCEREIWGGDERWRYADLGG